MGKTTLFHPVSLLVIRGAADYCGFKFGRIVQTHEDREANYARYTAELKSWPAKWDKSLPVVRLNMLRDCFMNDIEAHWLRQTKSGKWCVDLVTYLRPETENQ